MSSPGYCVNTLHAVDQEKREYAALKAYGFSPQKAAEIQLDAKRGDKHAQWWLRMAMGEVT